MRGKDAPGFRSPENSRITPAYAGKSTTTVQSNGPRKDHPRVCGEKIRAYVKIWNEWGSPPRMRGKVLAALMPTNALRITPAYAGKSWNSRWNLPCCKDHPRVCGEKNSMSEYFFAVLGSPPRMRGKAGSAPGFPLSLGITPAYAGKSRIGCSGNTGSKDHPRVCGEKSQH